MSISALFERTKSNWQIGRQLKSSAAFRASCLHLTRSCLNPVFVKVGANDGVTDDPCSDILLSNQNWTGLLIEPVPECFERLRSNFSDAKRFTLRQIAIGPVAREQDFYFVRPEAKISIPNLPSWFDQLGSFDERHILKHLDGLLGPFIASRKVEVLPLKDVLSQAGIVEIDLLHIDAEGYDLEVLKTLDWAVHDPVVIFVEHKHLQPSHKVEMLRMLRGQGYTVRDCGNDFFAEKKRRLSRRGYPSGQTRV